MLEFFTSNFTDSFAQGPINNYSVLVQIMALYWRGAMPLSESKMTRLLKHAYVTLLENHKPVLNVFDIHLIPMNIILVTLGLVKSALTMLLFLLIYS